MKTLKRILIVVLVLLVLAQIPFIYRRYQTGKLAEKIAQLDAQRTSYQDPNFKEYKGIIHAHTNLGGHSTGSFDELIAAANANDLDFVLMTEHFSDTFDTAEKTLNGVYGKTLFVGGNEIDTSDGDRFLLIPGGGEAAKARMSGTPAFLEKAHGSNQLALITYPEKFKSWDSNFDGIEVFSLHTEAKQMSWLTALGDLIWNYPSYPELTLAEHFTRPDANLAKFDEIASKRQISLFAGTDAHSDLGIHLIGTDGNQKLLNIKFDPYETMFRIARIHVLIPASSEFNRESLLEAIKAGRYFVGFDVLGDTTGVRFELQEAGRNLDPDSATESKTWISVIPPQSARIVLFANGEILEENRIVHGANDNPRLVPTAVNKDSDISIGVNFPVSSGVYRVELYRDDLGPPFDKIPWIMSNPIYVK